MALPRSLAPLRHRRYAAFWTGAFASNIGTWMETVAVGVLVTSQTGQAGWAGLVAAAGFVPNALLGALGGALADRVPRRRLLLGSVSVQTALAACASPSSIIDEFPPHAWQGATACADWANDFETFNKKEDRMRFRHE